jgi:hypothetical protein
MSGNYYICYANECKNNSGEQQVKSVVVTGIHTAWGDKDGQKTDASGRAV